jgi:ABC-type transporter Mla MlaB component
MSTSVGPSLPQAPHRLTALEAESFLAQHLSRAPESLDLSSLQECDSAGLAALVNLASKTTLLHASEKLRRLAALYGMDRIFS